MAKIKGRTAILTIRPLEYSKRDLNPHSRNGQGILSPSCLPIPPFEHLRRKKSGKRDSNSRPQPWQGCALPTELFPPDLRLQRYAVFSIPPNKNQIFSNLFLISYSLFRASIGVRFSKSTLRIVSLISVKSGSSS